MDEKLKQQIDSWTGANEDRKVIDLLEGISPADRGVKKRGYWHGLTIMLVSMKRL